MLPSPPKPDLDANDKEQKLLRQKAPEVGRYQRFHNIINEIEAVENPSYFQLEDYAEALAGVGRFRDASRLGTSKSDYYAEIDDAVWRQGDLCGCTGFHGTAKVAVDAQVENAQVVQKEASFSSWFTVRTIFSERHGKEVPLRKCNNCGLLDVED